MISLLTLGSLFALGAPSSFELPSAVKAKLDAAYPGWTLAPVSPEITRWFVEYRFTFAPSVVPCDLDNDKRTDFAVQILAGGKQIVVAFLDHGTWEMKELTRDSPDRFTYLIRYAKGEKDFDFEKLRAFRYAADAIGVMYFVKTPYTFTYAKGKFVKRLAPSDEEFDTN